VTEKLTPQTHSPAAIAPDFAAIEDFIAGFSLDAFNDPARVAAYVAHFGLDGALRQRESDRIRSDRGKFEASVNVSEEKPFEPEFADLARLHWLALRRKPINTLEFGSGFSTAILAHAMALLHPHFSGWAEANTRNPTPFHVYAVEEEQRFLDVTAQRLGDRLRPFVTLSRSSVELGLHDSRIVTFYARLPDVAPELIYLDGPSQFAATGDVSGISVAQRWRMPVAADLLRIEFFLEPGCLIVVDGRTANARFLAAYFKRNWKHHHDPVADTHYFELQETPLGPLNARKLAFCLNNTWLI
jgi:hypothetical protein